MSSRKRSAQPPTAANGELELNADAAQVLRSFRVVFNAVKRHFKQVERRAGIGGAQIWALSLIRDRPGISLGDLARAMDIHQSTASNLIKALQERGLVESVAGAHDRRARQLTIRSEGRKVLRRAPEPFTGVLPSALARLDARTLRRLQRDLEVVIDQLDADRRGGGVPLGQP